MTMRITFLVFSFFTALVPSVFLLPRLGLKRRTQLLLSAGLFFIASRFWASLVFTGSMFHPDWPAAVVCIWSVLDTVLSFFFFLQLPCYLFIRRISVKWRRITVVSLAAMAIVLSAAGLYECVKTPRVKEITVAFEDLPQAFDGYRIAHLSDIHCSQVTPRSRFEKIVSRTNAAKPDVICLTGDYVDGWVEQIGNNLEPFSGFSAPDGVLAVPGNHEYYWGWKEWKPFLLNCGITVLENSWTNIVRGSDSIVVAGLPDVAAANPIMQGADGSQIFDRREKLPHPDHCKAFDGAPDGSFRILLIHRPHSTLLASRSYNVKLQLSGHTHGGAFPGLAGFVARCNERNVRGLYRRGDLILYVSPGTGQWAGFPVRLFNPSEITVFTLKRSR